ncbi:hypothetical protein [Salidesulfovibrio brasiliensis]
MSHHVFLAGERLAVRFDRILVVGEIVAVVVMAVAMVMVMRMIAAAH